MHKKEKMMKNNVMDEKRKRVFLFIKRTKAAAINSDPSKEIEK